MVNKKIRVNKRLFLIFLLIIISFFSIKFYINKSDNNQNNINSNNNQQIKTYTIKFGQNNALSIENKELSCSTISSACAIKMPNIEPKDGYEVVGWSENKNSTIASYKVGNSYYFNSSKTLYAITKQVVTKKIYTITFESNNALSIGIKSLSCATNSNECSIIMPSITPKDGYEVVGWSENKNSTTATYIVGKNYSFNSNKTLYAITKSTNGFLSGNELIQFKNDNNINKSNDFVVQKITDSVNAIVLTLYYVYDKNEYDLTKLANLRTFSKHCLQYLSRIDTNIIKRVISNGTSIIFFGSYTCDASLVATNKYTYAAYCNSKNRNIVIGYESSRLNNNYYESSIIHEFGHAYDFTLRYLYVNDIGDAITSLSTDQIKNGFINKNGIFVNSNKIINLFLTDSNNQPYSWFDLAAKDAKKLKTWSDFSVYSLNDLLKLAHEYYAEVFQGYYINPNKLKSLGITSYNALLKTIS